MSYQSLWFFFLPKRSVASELHINVLCVCVPACLPKALPSLLFCVLSLRQIERYPPLSTFNPLLPATVLSRSLEAVFYFLDHGGAIIEIPGDCWLVGVSIRHEEHDVYTGNVVSGRGAKAWLNLFEIIIIMSHAAILVKFVS